ncbi:MAG: FkbM family methyltransferase [Verrucomicrobiales bacterium]
MLPRRFRNLRPYLASFVHSRFERPPLAEMARWLFQPGKEQRAAKYIESRESQDGLLTFKFHGINEFFYYPENASWIDLCENIDVVFNPANWHYFLSEGTPLTQEDTVVDCGAAEGLFTFFAARQARTVYAIEPIPAWHTALSRTLSQFSNVELLKVGVGHRDGRVRMTDDDVRSRISASGGLEIPIRSLDSLFAEADIPISFIKADIEGFEFPMLLGAEELIRRQRPKIAVTVYHEVNHFAEIKDFLSNIHTDYRFRIRGMAENGNPILLQAF